MDRGGGKYDRDCPPAVPAVDVPIVCQKLSVRNRIGFATPAFPAGFSTRLIAGECLPEKLDMLPSHRGDAESLLNGRSLPREIR